MSSRFVSAGTERPSSPKDDDWAKAKRDVENQREVKAIEPGRQDGGKSLYEVLQANKVAKQEAFEEAAKVRNQFRALDDGEIEFLDSVRASERAKETSIKRETAEQLDLFRKQQDAAAHLENDTENNVASSESSSQGQAWVTTKKRRRDPGDTLASTTKLRKSSSADVEGENTTAAPSAEVQICGSQASLSIAKGKPPLSSTVTTKDEGELGSKTRTSVLGLSAYDSEDE